MVKGLDIFRKTFESYTDQYILIGGSACELLLDSAGITFRATKDLDLVLCIDNLRTEFIRAFWSFIKAGKYQNIQKSTGKKLFYRFHSPVDSDFPFMIELFSRKPGALENKDVGKITPIPLEDDISSLSVILLDNEYYQFMITGKTILNGITLLKAEYIIPLKARAWLDLKHRKDSGSQVDDHNIKKHRNDVFRLAQLLTPETGISLAEHIEKDMNQFLTLVKSDYPPDLKSFGIMNTSLDTVLSLLKVIYRL